MIKAIVSDESLGFFERPWDLCFQNKRKSSRCERQDRLWLNKVECLFPGPNHPGQEYQKKSVRLLVDGAFYLSPENHELVPQQRVFRKEFGCSSGQIGECAKHKGGRWWFHPTQKTFLERMKATTDALFYEGKYTQHELNLSFVKWARCQRVQAEWALLIVLTSHRLRQGGQFYRAQHINFPNGCPKSPAHGYQA